MHMVDLTFFMSSYFFNFIFQTKSYFVFYRDDNCIFCYLLCFYWTVKFHFLLVSIFNYTFKLV